MRSCYVDVEGSSLVLYSLSTHRTLNETPKACYPHDRADARLLRLRDCTQSALQCTELSLPGGEYFLPSAKVYLSTPSKGTSHATPPEPMETDCPFPTNRFAQAMHLVSSVDLPLPRWPSVRDHLMLPKSHLCLNRERSAMRPTLAISDDLAAIAVTPYTHSEASEAGAIGSHPRSHTATCNTISP